MTAEFLVLLPIMPIFFATSLTARLGYEEARQTCRETLGDKFRSTDDARCPFTHQTARRQNTPVDCGVTRSLASETR